MGKNFLGLDGLKHFWTKAKSWIIDRITTEVTAKMAEIVANAPEDLDTLKEIADWISTHEDSASAMNTAILANTEAISGKADKRHTHTKSEITDFDALPVYSGNLNDLHSSGFAKYRATYSDLTNAPAIHYTPQICYIDVWSDTANTYQMIRIVGITYNPVADYGNTYIRSSHYTGSEYVWSAWRELATMDKVVQCVENKNPDAKTVTFELNSANWNCGTIYGNTNNGGNFKYDYYVTSNHIELVKQDVYGQQGSITASLSGTTLTLTASETSTIKTVTIIKS